MKKLSLILFLFLFTFKAVAKTSYILDLKMFISELVNAALINLSDNKITTDEKKKLLEKIDLENVEIDALGLCILVACNKPHDASAYTTYQKVFPT